MATLETPTKTVKQTSTIIKGALVSALDKNRIESNHLKTYNNHLNELCTKSILKMEQNSYENKKFLQQIKHEYLKVYDETHQTKLAKNSQYFKLMRAKNFDNENFFLPVLLKSLGDQEKNSARNFKDMFVRESSNTRIKNSIKLAKETSNIQPNPEAKSFKGTTLNGVLQTIKDVNTKKSHDSTQSAKNPLSSNFNETFIPIRNSSNSRVIKTVQPIKEPFNSHLNDVSQDKNDSSSLPLDNAIQIDENVINEPIKNISIRKHSFSRRINHELEKLKEMNYNIKKEVLLRNPNLTSFKTVRRERLDAKQMNEIRDSKIRFLQNTKTFGLSTCSRRCQFQI